MALLDGCMRVPALAALAPQVIHVDHGLHRESSRWANLVAEQCALRGLHCRIERVTVIERREASLEAAARDARYRVFADCLAAGGELWLAHHATDQALTVLQRLLRGSGARGLAAMPAARPLGRGLLRRPLLELPKQAITEHLEAHGLSPIHDPANDDPRFSRVRLAQDLWPELLRVAPDAERTLVQTAARLRQASEAIEVLATAALIRARSVDGALLWPALAAAPKALAVEMLRLWCLEHGQTAPNAVHVDQLWQQMGHGSAQLAVPWPGGGVRRYRDRLYPWALPPAPVETDWDGSTPAAYGAAQLSLQPAAARTPLRIGQATPGLVIANARGQHQALRKLFQQHGVAPWRRPFWPILYAADGYALGAPGLLASPALSGWLAGAELELRWATAST